MNKKMTEGLIKDIRDNMSLTPYEVEDLAEILIKLGWVKPDGKGKN